MQRITLDPWQEDVMNTEGNMCLRSGRQVGKSFIIGMKAARYAIDNPDKLIMVIAFTEKQANLLFAKILNNIVGIEKEDKKKYIGKPKPTKHVINLKNGSTIHCYAAGDTGFGIMGFTIDLLIADEAAWIKEEVWNSVIPALAVTKGNIWLLSTPYLSFGYYYDCFHNKLFTSFHQTSEECPRRDDDFLEEQRRRLTKAQYSQMYLGEFIDDAHRVFSDEWIDQVCTIQTDNTNPTHENKVIGIDVAGTGDDESTYQGLVRPKDIITQFYHEVIEKPSNWIIDMMDKIKYINKLYEPKKFGIDGGGLGSGVVHLCLADEELKSKTIDLNNAKRNIDAKSRQTSKYMKEAMYMNFLAMGQHGQLKLFNSDDIKLSLRSIISEKKEGGGEKISGNYSHIVEGLIRAAWLLKSKSLNPWISSFSV